MLCDLRQINEATFVCVNCGHSHSFEYGITLPIYIECFAIKPSTNGLGDWIAWLLSKLGITIERVQRIFGTCYCEKRKTALNKFGDKITQFLARGY